MYHSAVGFEEVGVASVSIVVEIRDKHYGSYCVIVREAVEDLLLECRAVGQPCVKISERGRACGIRELLDGLPMLRGDRADCDDELDAVAVAP
jgi:hypothetical protein